MNSIYKVIWSKAKNCYVVASEIAKSHTKSASGQSVRRSALASLLALSFLCGGLGVASAADVVKVDVSTTSTTEVYTKEGTESYVNQALTHFDTKTEVDEKIEALKTGDVATNKDNITALQTTTNELDGKITANTTKINANETAINDLKTKAVTTDATLTNLSGRMAAAESDIDGLQADMATAKSDINTLKADVSTAKSDINTLKAKDTELSGKIDTETANRITSDTALDHKIDAEIANRITSDTALDHKIDAEIANRITSDTALDQKIDKEIQDRENAINATDDRTGGIARNVEDTQTTIEGIVKVDNQGNVKDVKGLSAETINTTGDATIGGKLGVTGETTLNDKLTAKGEATFEKNVTAEKDLTVNGTLNTKDVTAETIHISKSEDTPAYKSEGSIIGEGGNLSVSNKKTDKSTNITKESELNVNEEGTVNWATSKDNATGNVTEGRSEVKADHIKNSVKKTEGGTTFGYEENITETGKVGTATDKDGNRNELTQTATGTENTVTSKDGNKSTTKQEAGSISSTVYDKDGNVKASSEMKEDGSISNNATGDMTNTVGGNQTNEIGGDQENTIGGNQTTTVKGNVKEDYKKDLTTTVGGNELHEVTGTKTENVTGMVKENYSNGQETNVTGNQDIYVSENQTNKIDGDQVNTIGGDQTTTAKNITNAADETLTDKVGTNTRVINSRSITDTVGVANRMIEDGKITDNAGDFTVTTDKENGTTFTNAGSTASSFTTVDGTPTGRARESTNIKGNEISTGKVEANYVKMDYADVMHDLGVHGSATVDNDLTVKGTTKTKTLNVTEDASVGRDLSVGGNATIAGDVTARSYKVDGKTYIDANGINANNQKITNVADGSISEGSKDAVNGGQLYGVKRDLEHQVDKVGANAAAMANLRPMEFDPSSKWNIAAAIGNYGSETAAALGAFYRPNDDVMVNLSTAFGTGENMVGGGVSVRLGKGGNKLSREETNALKAQVADLSARMDALLSVLNPNMSKDFPDVPENHWAYEAVSRLAGNDIVQGYPDGEFHGERTMTRYEMAEIIYNALSRGAEAERELVEEFKPELQAMAASEKATAEKAEG